jgi:AcrR family transcriptional regulator
VLRRAAPEDALDFAQAAFISGDRLELGTLAERLSVGRTTLYRWFGTREQLLERVLVRLTRQFSAAAQAELQLNGIDRVLEFTRHMINATIGFEPAQAFVNREPQLALRLLIGEHGAVHRAIVEEILAVLAQAEAVEDMSGLEDRVNVAVQVGTALQWATSPSAISPIHSACSTSCKCSSLATELVAHLRLPLTIKLLGGRREDSPQVTLTALEREYIGDNRDGVGTAISGA